MSFLGEERCSEARDLQFELLSSWEGVRRVRFDSTYQQGLQVTWVCHETFAVLARGSRLDAYKAC